MFTNVTINGKVHTLVLSSSLNGSEKIDRRFMAGQVVQTQATPQGQKVDLADVANRLQGLVSQVQSLFVGRDEMIEMFTLALASGEHGFVLSAPGTAKTAVMNALGQGIGGTVWDILMNEDIDRNTLLGPVDAVAYQNGTWRRNWSALATADVAIIDEVWKSSGQNANLLLDALNERVAREGNDKINIPLVSALSSSNEYPEDSYRQAIYDRFLLRISVSYIKAIDSFESMLTADAGTVTINPVIHPDELRLMAAAAELWALNPPQDLIDTVKALWSDIGTNGRSVSDRRWRKLLKVACAWGLMHGQDPNATHAAVGKWVLWQDPEDEQEIRKLVLSRTDPFAGLVLDLQAKMADLRTGKSNLEAGNLEQMTELTGKAGKLVKEVNQTMNQPGIGSHKKTLAELVSEAQAFIMEVLAG